MRDAGDAEKRICLIFAPRFLRGVFFAAKNPAYWICKNKKKGTKKMTDSSEITVNPATGKTGHI